EVRRQEHRLATGAGDRLDDGRAARDVAAVHRDPSALPRAQDRRVLADARRRAGDQQAFASEPHRGGAQKPYAVFSSGSLAASIWATFTITLHCFQVASSCILPSIMWTPRPSGMASSTFFAKRTSSAGGLKTFFAIAIWLGCSDQAPTQPSRNAARN